MNKLYQQALNQSLVTKLKNKELDKVKTTIVNSLHVPISIYLIDGNGSHVPVKGIKNSEESVVNILPKQQKDINLEPGYYVVKALLTGGFVSVFDIQDKKNPETVNIEYKALTSPNDIGEFPKPRISENYFIPNDSIRILVGNGTLTVKNKVIVITREQYWKLSPDSFTLSPGEETTVSLTTMTGREDISSSEETISKDLGINMSAGWGPFSASISASLSVNSTNFQQVTITNENTQYESSFRKNTSNDIQLYLKWQLTDVITLYDASVAKDELKPNASIVTTQPPILIDGPYILPSPKKSVRNK